MATIKICDICRNPLNYKGYTEVMRKTRVKKHFFDWFDGSPYESVLELCPDCLNKIIKVAETKELGK